MGPNGYERGLRTLTCNAQRASPRLVRRARTFLLEAQFLRRSSQPVAADPTYRSLPTGVSTAAAIRGAMRGKTLRRIAEQRTVNAAWKQFQL